MAVAGSIAAKKAESNESNLFIQKLECSDGIQLIIWQPRVNIRIKITIMSTRTVKLHKCRSIYVNSEVFFDMWKWDYQTKNKKPKKHTYPTQVSQ